MARRSRAAINWRRRCRNCHGSHEILAIKDPRSPVQPARIPYLCGQCHSEGTPVQRQRTIHQSNILSNYSESIHGDGAHEQGARGHGDLRLLSHRALDPAAHRPQVLDRPGQHRGDLHQVSRPDRGGAPEGDPGRAVGAARRTSFRPAWTATSRTRSARSSTTQGMADGDCMRCHEQRRPSRPRGTAARSSPTGLALAASASQAACSQCHTGVNASRPRPCETLTAKVDCSSATPRSASLYRTSTHGQLAAKGDPNAPDLQRMPRHPRGQGQAGPALADLPAATCPASARAATASGKKAALRYTGDQAPDRRALQREHPWQGAARRAG